MIFKIFVSIIAILALLILLFSKGIITMKTKSTVINESKFLKTHLTDNIATSNNSKPKFLHPFNLKIETMDKLLLVDIEDDPIYETFELQEFDDEVSKGLVILMYHKDKEVDVYYTEGINHDFYKGSENGTVSEIKVKEYSFNKSDELFNFLISFNDKDGKEIYINIEERNTNKEYFSILAPAGDMIDNFTSFPLFFMKETTFLEKESSKIVIRIGDQDRVPVAIPIAINGKFVYLSRYCLDPVVASFNENYKGKLDNTLFQDESLKNIERAGEGEGKLLALEYEKFNHEVSIKFSPLIPDLNSIKDGTRIDGRFSTSVDGETGILAGDYFIVKSGDKVTISLHPKKGWQPMPGKRWFSRYKWVSSITCSDEGLYADSKWIKSTN